LIRTAVADPLYQRVSVHLVELQGQLVGHL